MKFTINGFSQKKLVEFDLDSDDALILRYFVDFKDSSKMVCKNIEDKIYYWLKYETIKKELPVLKLKKDSIYRRLKKMCDCGVLEHVTVKKKGVYSFYRLGSRYTELIRDTSEINPTPIGNKSDTHTDLNPEQKINLLKDSSIKDIYCSVVDYMNKAIGSKYKATSRETQRFIHSRLEEGFTVDDFKTVIDKKTKEWKSTDMEKYIRPSTLFGNKFEQYLNQADTTNKGNNNGTFQDDAHKPFKYD